MYRRQPVLHPLDRREAVGRQESPLTILGHVAVNFRLYRGFMDRDTPYRMSLALLVSVAIAAGVSAPVAAGEGGTLRLVRVLPDEPLLQCVAPSEFTIAGLRLDDEMAALQPLGSPDALTRGFGEDDGGDYVVTTYHYGGLEVDVVRGRVDRIEAHAPAWPTPAGLTAGMQRTGAMLILGREPDPEYLHDGIYSFSGCPEWRDGELVWDNTNSYFDFAFDDDARLAFVRLIADRP